MSRMSYSPRAKYLLAASFLFFTSAGCQAFDGPTKTFVVAAKQAKCSAPTVMDYEGTDMSGVTPKCDAIFNDCVNEALPCNVRKQKCAQFDKMDQDGSCYKKKR